MTTSADAGMLVLRLAVALIMFFHGTQKLFGWWDGQGLDGATRFFASQGFRPPRAMAVVAGLTEIGGSLSLASGLLTPLGVTMLGGVLTNIVAVHVRNGLDHRKHGFEFELALLAGVVAIGLVGAGRWSLDHAWAVGGPDWLGAGAVGLGIVSGLGIVASRDRGSHAPTETAGSVAAQRPRP
ncbi:DoxX family protein [Streptomyces sp. NPDC092369]|uniref:DoxX family protein n=1 Tax=Streptomyces sp. NPDC092369 TaxID=3366015 RepID=UPI0037F49691